MSTLKANTLQTVAGVEMTPAKAWVNFNGSGTVAVRAAVNVSSITDNGTGAYTVNFANAMADANYSVSFGAGLSGSLVVGMRSNTSPTPTTTALAVEFRTISAATAVDPTYCDVAVFR